MSELSAEERVLAEALTEALYETETSGGWWGHPECEEFGRLIAPRIAARVSADAGRLAEVWALAPLARRIVEQTDTICTCPDEPHQNALHDLAHDLSAALDAPARDTP